MTPAAESAETRAGLAAVPATTGTKRQILDVATQLFRERGYDATSLRQIAESLGITKAAVYYHFPAKEHLLLELTRPMLDDLAELVTNLRSHDTSGTEEAALAAYLDVFIEHLSVLHLLAGDPATQNHPDVGQRVRALVEAIQRLVAGPDATAERTVLTACAMGVAGAVAALPPEVASENRDLILAAAVAVLRQA